ncbi:MAG: alginate export family protein [Akkermansiaceae bacterium]
MKTTHALTVIMLTAGTCVTLAGEKSEITIPEKTNSRSFIESLNPFVNARLRYEYADLAGTNDATLGSLRTYFGIKTDSIHGFKFLAEGEHTWVLTNTSRYTAFPGFPNNGRSVIADPDNFELNRLQLSYEAEGIDTTVTVGRQHIKFADERFIGAIGWRQNDETYDAVVLENKSITDLHVTYAFINQVNRIFGDDAPARALDRWEGESHLIHLEYEGLENHTLRAFAYLLDFDRTAAGRANSSDTYGIELQGQRELSSGSKLNYLLTAASQTDGSSNPANYNEFYYRAQLGVENDVVHYGAGVEVLTSDGVSSFRFPLGTNHPFNGFADAFVTTPATGLVDYYTWIGTKAFGFKHKLIAHQFNSESGSIRYGWEIDYVAVRPISENAKVVLKAAHLDGKGAQRDTTRASAEINYSF